MRKFAYTLLASLLLVSCFERLPENKAYEHMLENGFDKLQQQFDDPSRAEWQKVDEVLDFMKIEPDEVVAEIGPGTGYFTFPLAERCNKVIALDIDTAFINHLNRQKAQKRIGNIEIRLTERDEPMLQPMECDKIVLVNSVHQLEKTAKYLSKARKLLPIGGSVLIVDFKRGELPVGPSEVDRLPLNQLSRELGLAGFRSVEVDTTTLPYQYMVRAY